VAENQLPGTPQSVWNIGPGDDTIDGYTTSISYNAGQTVNFKINTPSTHYLINIYRMGYYGGDGARLVASQDIVLSSPQVQPAPVIDDSTQLADYGTWHVSATWAIPTTAVSGVYFADVIREDGVQDHSMIFWVVRNDASTSGIVYMTSDTTWEAYNLYGNGSLYTGNAGFSATYGSGYNYGVSYNRPFTDEEVPGGFGTRDFVFHAEFPMIMWLEENGYDVSYLAHPDLDQDPTLLLNHKVFMDCGHDEYWSAQEVAAVQAAQNAGVNCAFFSGNEMYWEIRWANSIDGSNTPYRSELCYKESFPGNPDPQTPPLWTGTWMDPAGAGTGGYLPGNAVTGTLFVVNRGTNDLGGPLTVPYLDSRYLFWANTSVAQLTTGQQATLGDYELGYEWDVDADNGFRPAGLIDLSSTTENAPQVALDPAGITFGQAEATNSQTLFRTSSGALVFGAGTVQWSWGLESVHDEGPSVVVPAIEQATVNLFAMMGVQPATLIAGLVPGPTPAQMDTTPPVSTVTSVGGFPFVQTGASYQITGTATDAGGGVVAGVEVSVDGGATWHPATPTGNSGNGWGTWSYTWTPSTTGTFTIESRAVNDSLYLETPSDQVSVTVKPASTTPPQVAGITAKATSTQSAVISWITDKLTTSQVIYGTSAQNLNLSVSDTTLNVPHSLALTGLTPNTTYYYQVVSVDSYGHTTTAPASPQSFMTPGFFDSDATFGSGTLASASISQSGIILPAVTDYEFSGTTLPAGWTSTPNATGGSATVGGGVLTVNGALAQTTSNFGPGESLQFTANFGGAQFQIIGFGSNLNNGPYAIFSTGSAGNALYAQTLVNGSATNALLEGANLIGTPHVFRIDWNTTTINYWIDGALVASAAAPITTAMHLVASVLNVGSGNTVQIIHTDDGTSTITVGSNITVNWMRVAPYSSSGTFTSAVFDAGAQVTWNTLTWDGATPPSTSLTLDVRFGNTPTPDSTWTAFLPLAGFGSTLGTFSRYLQYQAALTTTDADQTPSLAAVGITYNAGAQTLPPVIVTRTPAPGATTADFTSPIMVEFSDLMNQATVNSTTFYLRAAGTSSNVPATVSFTAGSTAVLQPTEPLTAVTTYTATVSGSVTDAGGTPLGSDISWSFTTPLYSYLTEPGPTDDFGSGTTGSNTVVTPPGVTLAPTIFAAFSGTTLPAGWSVTPYATGGSGTVANGLLTVDGALAASNTFYGPGQSLQFVATFTGDAEQHAGLATDLLGAPWAIFSTLTGGALYARTNNGSTSTDTLLPGNWLRAPHLFRINWSSSGVTYFIDGNEVASSSLPITTSMRPVFSDLTVGGGTLAVASVGLTPAATSGSFLSRVFDADQPVTWNTIQWTGTVPSATSLTIDVRMGNTPAPDSSWTSFIPVANSGAVIGGSSRYFQYEAVLATADPTLAPILNNVTIQYTNLADTVPPTIVSSSPAPGATGADYAAPITVAFSELMNAATINTSTLRLRQVGTTSDVPATISYAGSTATLQPLGILNGNKQYQVTVSGSITDSTGNPLGSDVTWTFTTRVYSFSDQSLANLLAGTTGPNTSVAGNGTGGGQVTLSPAVGLDLSGTSLPSGWASSPWGTGASATVSGGLLTVDGTLVATTTLFGPARSLDSVATFSGDPFEHLGFAVDTTNAPWAMFSTSSGGGLYALTSNGTTSNKTLIPGNWFGSPHDFHIDWTASSVTYSIDGKVVVADAIGITANMRPIISDLTPGGTVTVNYFQVTPYTAAGSFLSRVFDAGQAVRWLSASWVSNVPAGTTLGLSVRMGNTPTPDSTWTSFVPLSSPGATIGGVSRYLQYEANLASSVQDLTPALDGVTIDYTTDPDTVAPTIVSQAPAPGAVGADYAAPITIGFSELMNPATINSSTVRLRQVGATSDVPATVSYVGSTAILQPSSILAGLTQYQVTVAGSVSDVSGNPLGSDVVWDFTTRVLSFSDGAVADFSAGTMGANTLVSTVPLGTGGQVDLTPAVSLSLTSGPSLPAGWVSTPWASGGSATVSGGLLTVDGSLVTTSAIYGPARTLDTVATFSGGPFEHVGFAVDTSSAPWAMFSTGSGGALYALTNNGTTSNSTLIPGNWLGAPHRFRIDWTSTSVTYSIDGNVVATDNIGITGLMHPVISDLNAGGGTVVVSWLQMTPYATSGTFLSQVFNATRPETWSSASWITSLPAGTSVNIFVRMGNTPAPDGTWTAWVPLATSGATIGGVSQYIQYRADLTTTAPNQTPALQGLTIDYTLNPDTVPPTIVSASPGPGATAVPYGVPITVTFSELMNAATITPATFSLQVVGSGTNVPATVSYAGSTATLQPSAPLLPSTQYQVTLTSGITDGSGNPLAATSYTFKTQILSVTDTSVSNFSAGTLGPNLYVSQTGDGEVILAPTVGSEFSGTSLDAGWSGTPLAGGGTAVEGGGVLAVDGDIVATTGAYGAGRSLEFSATFSGDPFQHAGFGANLLNSAPWAIFTTSSGGALYTFTNSGSTSSLTRIPGNWLGTAHDFRIDWSATSVTYSIDGAVVATDDLAIANNMSPLISDLNVGGGTVVVDWMRMTPYAPSGTFISRVFDAGEGVTWNTLSWDDSTPANTSLTLSVRTGNTPTPDSTWTAFTPVTTSGGTIGVASRYAQYEAALATSDPNQTPALQDVTLTFITGVPVAFNGSVTTNENVPIGGTLAATDPLGNALTYSVVGTPAHGTVTVNLSTGDFSYTPAANYSGTDSFSFQVTDPSSLTSNVAVETIAVNRVNQPPTFTAGADQTVLENAGSQTVNGWATQVSPGPPSQSGETVNFLVSTNNPGLFAVQPAIDAAGNLTYTPAANMSGTAAVTVQAQNSGGTASGGQDTSAPQTFNINVLFVNQPPSFNKGQDQTVLVNAGPQMVSGWATNISPGPNQSNLTVTFLVSNNNPSLFTVQPWIDASGMLIYTPAANALGTATVTARLQNSGGTANGGQDTSAPQTFVVNVVPSLVLSGLPASTTAGVANVITVTAEDATGAPVAGYTGTVHFSSSDVQAGLPADYTFTTGPGGDNGVHTFTATLKTAGIQTLSITDAANSSLHASVSATVSPGAASQLVITQQPSATATAGVAFASQPVVAEEDAFGNILTSDSSDTVTAVGTGTAGLQGTATLTLSNGVATFSNLAYDKAETLTLTFNSNASGVSSATSGNIVVSPGAASQLVITQQPSATATAGVAFASQPVVAEEDAFGNILASDSTHTVTAASTGTAGLQGTTTLTLSNGVASFSGLSYNKAETMSIAFSTNASNVSSATSSKISISPAAASTLVVSGFPSPTTAGVAQNFTVTALDAFGNTATGYRGTVHFTSSDTQAALPADYAFTGGDAGVHTFSATLKTAGSRSLTATDTATAGITGSQSGIAVSPAAASSFVVSGFPSPTTAGVAQNFTVTAKDAYGNTATGYTGTVHFTSSDTQAALPANYTFATADAGAHTFSATLKTAGSQSLTATDTVTGAITGSQAGIAVSPAAASSFVVSGFPSPTTAGVAQNFTVTAKDAYGNTATGYRGTVHFTSSDTQAALPADYTFATADAGTHAFTATLKIVGTRSLTATDTVTGSITGSQSGITVNPAAASRFAVAGYASPTTAGTAHTFTVTAFDPYGNTATGYRGTVHFTSSDGQAALPADYAFNAADAGAHTFTATLKTVGGQSLTATDTATTSITGSQAGISVTPAAASTLVVSGFPSPATAGAAQNFTVTARDAYGNTATGYTGTVHFTSSDAQAALPANYTFATADAGAHTFSATLKTAGSQSLTATDTVTGAITGSQAGIAVSPAAASSFVVSGFPSPTTAGVAQNFTVTAKDAYGNTATGYRGTVHFTSSDTQAALPTDYAFTATDAGVHSFAATLKTAAGQSLTATDKVTPAVTGSQTGITVNPASTSAFGVSGYPSPTIAGTAQNFTVKAKDAYGNTTPAYRGTVHFTSSDAQAALPANYAFTGTDAGVHTFSAMLKTAGSQSLTATDTATASITGSQAGITVNPAAAKSVVVSGYPSPTTAGVAQGFTVTAKDPYGNTATGFTDTVRFSSSDSKAALPANYTFTAADAGAHTFSATLKTVGTQSITATDTTTNNLAGSQAGISVNPAAASNFVVSGFPSPTTAGVSQNFTVTALDAFGNAATGYRGTVHFTSSDAQAALPANYTFTATDAGTHTFTATLKTAGAQSLTATDTVTTTITGSQTGITVNAAAAVRILISAPTTVTHGVSFTFTVTALDAYGNVATGYRGTIHFTSSDSRAVLPANFTFKNSDGGVHTFTATFNTKGTQSLTATDTGNSTITGTQTGIQVVSATMEVSPLDTQEDWGEDDDDPDAPDYRRDRMRPDVLVAAPSGDALSAWATGGEDYLNAVAGNLVARTLPQRKGHATAAPTTRGQLAAAAFSGPEEGAWVRESEQSAAALAIVALAFLNRAPETPAEQRKRSRNRPMPRPKGAR
jgi:hypothetical protein